MQLADLAPAERQTRAYELSVAALMADSIYNFGELLLHPVLDALAGTPHAWLRELVFAFHRGDLPAYAALAPQLAKNALLHAHKAALDEKIALAALAEAVFRRAPHDRALPFAVIAAHARVPPDAVEHLVMKALSLGLVRGAIDQVAQRARIHWVQPKVLDMAQIDSMRRRLQQWDASVNQLGNWIERVGQDVWAT